MWFFLISTIFFGAVLAQASSNRDTIEWETKIIIQDLKQKCHDTGNAELFNHFKSTGALESCRVSIVDLYVSVRSSVETNGTVTDDTIEKVCKLLKNESHNCAKVAHVLMPCLSGDDQIGSFLSGILLMDPLSQYACNADGREIKSFIKDGGVECMKQTSYPLLACDEEIEEKRIRFLKEKECKQIQAMDACVTGIIVGNCKQNVTDFLMSLINISRNATPCRHFIPKIALDYAEGNFTKAKDILVPITSNSTTALPQTTDCISGASVLSTLRTIERKLDQDDLDSFGQYLVSSLRKFNPLLRVYAKADIQRLLSKYELQAVEKNV